MLDPHTGTVNGHEYRMIPVEGGSYKMGSPDDDPEAAGDEKPQHPVTVADYYIGQYPVTQALWKVVMNGENPSGFPGDDRPVERVSWEEVQGFMQQLNELTKKSRLDGHLYRLPTEAEWEYAARGGKYYLEGYKYAGSDRLKDVGWFNANSDGETKPVGLKYPNQLGIHEMSGNVWEWCDDDWHADYKGSPIDGSAWVERPKRRAYRVIRGGGWYYHARYCRVAYRNYDGPDYRYHYIGFRLVLAL